MILLQKPTNSLGFGHENVPDPMNSYDLSVAHLALWRFGGLDVWGFGDSEAWDVA